MGKYELGMIGLGVMGRNLLLNMADHGYSVAGYDKDLIKVDALRKEAQKGNVDGVRSIEELLGSLVSPRAIMFLVPAGKPVDDVIEGLLPHLTKGDILIDGGNSHFRDTDRRIAALAQKGISLLGVGISGGESGARRGPSIMAGGDRDAYERIRPIMEAISAKVNGEPCAAWVGPGSAGHYVKMVHNGIEYGMMRVIAETYDIMKRGLSLSNQELHDVYKRWSTQETAGYLLEITADIFSKIDDRTGKHLIDLIVDQADQKGTGMWASESAFELQVPLPTIDVEVMMRDVSANKDLRVTGSRIICGPSPHFRGNAQRFVIRLKNALYAGMIITYTQGMALLRKASDALAYGFDLQEIARIWRGGCIIRSALLENVRAAFVHSPRMPSLFEDEHLAEELMNRQSDLRAVVATAAELGIPAPGMMASLAYFDSYRSSWLPANLVQAQRDYFGSHTYKRVDIKGVFHTQWKEE
jgi:6-phosphogluconate dehydrogenase